MPGVVDTLDHGEWQAHVQMRLNGKNVHVRGPRRTAQEKRKAEFDLAMIQEAWTSAAARRERSSCSSCLERWRGNFLAQIRPHNCKNTRLGTFKSELEASLTAQ